MIQSMTAFARAQTQSDLTTTLCWEIRSVNHRYLEVYFRLPEAFKFLEAELRNRLREYCSRGKFECHLKLTEGFTPGQTIAINEPLVDTLVAVGEDLARRKHLPNDLTLTSLLNWPGIVTIDQPDMEGIGKQATLLFNQALATLCETRKIEGQALAAQLTSRLQLMHEEISKARVFAATAMASAREKIQQRMTTLQLEIDNHRLEQEVALLLTRLDVSEELDRLHIHLLEVARILSNTDSVGRRLDFLMQELNREANTLSSKSDSTALTQSAIEMKVLIEQMREQIQNIE